MLKKTLTATALSILIPATASADAMCESLAELAKSVMTERQSGTPMVDIMKRVSNDSTAEIARGLIMMAYDRPAFSTEDYKQKEVVRFQDSVYLKCLRGSR